MVVVTPLYEFIKIHGTTHLNNVDFTTSILYLNKPDFKEIVLTSICIYTVSIYSELFDCPLHQTLIFMKRLFKFCSLLYIQKLIGILGIQYLSKYLLGSVFVK